MLVNVDGIMSILYILETKTYIALEIRSLRTLVRKKMHLITYFDLLNEQLGNKSNESSLFLYFEKERIGCFPHRA